MAEDNHNANGPIILWVDYGYEGWKPQSFSTVREALLADKYGSKYVITRLCDFVVIEKVNGPIS